MKQCLLGHSKLPRQFHEDPKLLKQISKSSKWLMMSQPTIPEDIGPGAADFSQLHFFSTLGTNIARRDTKKTSLHRDLWLKNLDLDSLEALHIKLQHTCISLSWVCGKSSYRSIITGYGEVG